MQKPIASVVPEATSVPAVAGTAPVPASTGRGTLSMVAVALGALGLRQAAAVLMYTPSFIYLDVAPYRFDSRDYIATMWGGARTRSGWIGGRRIATHRGDRQGPVAAGVAATGALVVGWVLIKYGNA